jgi:hypothetical protein
LRRSLSLLNRKLASSCGCGDSSSARVRHRLNLSRPRSSRIRRAMRILDAIAAMRDPLAAAIGMVGIIAVAEIGIAIAHDLTRRESRLNSVRHDAIRSRRASANPAKRVSIATSLRGNPCRQQLSR